ncbi:LIG4 [Candida pseudojiufengensis]|uniref:LIG4 n=1 Tax=Candida pseudojiufengensis TaxID=497109 RepID=UPI0022252467|nr:LIG4 [Candida pseudojiufengensis]KAI5964612.1 LIG4 [Candida pseudojiufengensis]
MSPFNGEVKPPPPNNVEPTLTLLTKELFDKIYGVSRENMGEASTMTERKAQIINQFIDTFKTHIGLDIFPSSKLIFPEKAGRLYYMQEKTLAQIIIKMYHIPKNSEDWNTLNFWNRKYQASKRFSSDEKKLRDIAIQASKIIAHRRDVSEFEEYTVADINKALDELASSDSKNGKEKVQILKPLFDHLRLEELRWFIHFILKKPILQNIEKLFFNSWHPDAYRMFSLCNNLELTFNSLYDPEKRLTRQDLSIRPRFKFKPQLATKLTKNYDVVVKRLHKTIPMDETYETKLKEWHLEDKFYIEEKMDGDRMLLHKEGKHFKFFTRRLKDYTYLYGEKLHVGSLTKYLANAFAKNVESVILDGEMVAWDYEREAILPFGTLKSSAIQEDVRQFNTVDSYEQLKSYPYYLVFDILYLNGKDLSNYPLFFRKHILKKIINPVPHRFEIHEARIGSTPADIERAIREVVQSRGEGLLLKHIQSKYFIDGYRNPDWIKVKPEYLEGLGENLDLVVIGKTPGIKNSYMMGLRSVDDNVYYSFCTCGNGFTIDEFATIERLTNGKWVELAKEKPPDSLIKFGRKVPDFWIDPKDSIVLEIRARSIDVRPELTYAVGTTLHNLYSRRIRLDKSIDECITLQDYQELKKDHTRNIEKNQTALSKKRNFDALTSFNNPIGLKRVKIESDLFSNFEFLIMSDKKDYDGSITTKDDLKEVVKKYGGNNVHSLNPNSDRQIVAITEKDLPVGTNYLEQGIDLIKPSWILECIKRNRIVQIEPFFVYATKNWDMYEKRVDEFGDSYMIHTPLNAISTPKLKKYELDKLRSEFEWSDSNRPLLYLFKGMDFYVLGDSLSSQVIKERIQRFGGNITEDFINCGYIVVSRRDEIKEREKTNFKVREILREIDDNLEIRNGKFKNGLPHTVLEGFIEESIKFNCIVDPQDYKLVSKKLFTIN